MSDNTSTAAEQLSAVNAGATAGNEIGRAGRTHDALFGSAVGILIAGMLAVVVFVYPTHEVWYIGPSTVAYGVGIGVVGAVYRMRRNGTSRLTAQRYKVGFFSTISLYAIGVVLSVLDLSLPLWFWIPYIAATALPLAISSTLRPARER